LEKDPEKKKKDQLFGSQTFNALANKFTVTQKDLERVNRVRSETRERRGEQPQKRARSLGGVESRRRRERKLIKAKVNRRKSG